ncbi:hypothetical protein GIB67_015059 [Kingdonia uniflora]|uniref:Increased DNA methylation 1 C-terminal domain-containing protein n=1 Tax=Kingdonia uniflora TaxID=39325 RepID=A0A7J7NNI9_9MAGN|nr:hypothetical protein GIB67_015059 [Kingdonia uniflora]
MGREPPNKAYMIPLRTMMDQVALTDRGFFEDSWPCGGCDPPPREESWDCFDPIVEGTGRDLIPDMVYGRNISGLEFGGMYCAVLTVKSVVVSAGVLRIFNQEVAELPLVATTRDSQGKALVDHLRRFLIHLIHCISFLMGSFNPDRIIRFLRWLNVENLVLPAAEVAESIWTNKFGFQKMSHDRFQKYSKDFQLTNFKGTSMLEKTVPKLSPELRQKCSSFVS